MTDLNTRYHAHRNRLSEAGQEHLLAFWHRLDKARQAQLLADLDQVDLARCAPLIDPLIRNRPRLDVPERIEPPQPFPVRPTADLVKRYDEARAAGATAIHAGRVAAFTVAGGQGTRLGYDGPKGGFRVSPIRNAPLFQLFAEQLLGIERALGARPRWYIMTSPANHQPTIQIFEEARYFGLSQAGVRFFPQAQMPAFHPDGRIALEDHHRVALSPDGHGGSLAALRSSGALDEMRTHGVDVISYFQVDNPLVHAIDPLFVGLHLLEGSEMSSKAVAKADDLERVGNFCLVDGRLSVIEYSDLPDSLARQRNADGSRRFDAGSIAIHLLDREFVERLTAPGATVQLPWHRADKKVSVIDEAGHRVTPSSPNVVKLEMFVFDAIPLARNALLMMTAREEEFSPVKNAEGTDSPATSRRDQVRRAARWLEACGVTVRRGPDGEPTATVEISPKFANSVDELRRRVGSQISIAAGQSLLLE